MDYTRRDLGRLALAGLPALVFGSAAGRALHAQATRPDSRWAGVQVGMNVPYNFGGRNMPKDEMLAHCLTLGVSALEMRAQPIETFLNVPVLPASAQMAPNESRATGLLPDEEAMLRESVAMAQKTFAERLAQWRAGVSLDPLATFRRQFEDAGVRTEIVKWDGIHQMTDAEIDYCFRLGKAMGARALSTEISEAGPKRLAPFAARHQMLIGFHGHAETGAATFEAAFAEGPFVGANLDIGHWVAGGHGSPLPFLEKHTSRITHIHVKDRKLNNGPNTAFGLGDTPVREVLQTMRDRKWAFQATIEFEYPVPAGSTRMAEMAKAMAYCRQCLLG